MKEFKLFKQQSEFFKKDVDTIFNYASSRRSGLNFYFYQKLLTYPIGFKILWCFSERKIELLKVDNDLFKIKTFFKPKEFNFY